MRSDPKDPDGVKSFRMDRSDEKTVLQLATDDIIDTAEQTRLIRFAENRAKSHRLLTALIAILIPLVTIGGLYLVGTGDIIPCSALLVVIVLAYLHGRDRSKHARGVLSQLLRERGIRPKLCLMCKYELKGSVAAICPECGEPLAPPVEPDQHSNT